MKTYVHERPDWPRFRWNAGELAARLAEVRLRQGRLIGRMESLGFPLRSDAVLEAVTSEVVKSSEIEGEALDRRQVRSSVARHLGLKVAGLVPSDRRVDGVVEMTLEAVEGHGKPLAAKRLFGWHRLLFPRPGALRVGAWRDGPMQVVSGAMGRERVHFEAPAASRLEAEMDAFLEWSNGAPDLDPLLRAALAHLWFVTIHPFEDGNGRIARAITEWALARSEMSPQRYYSMSSQIRQERNDYYEILERTQKGTLDVTAWMRWFLDCLHRAMVASESSLSRVFAKDGFWRTHAATPMNDRQRRMLNELLDATLVGKLTTTRWAKMTKCSQDTALRDILQLVDAGILVKDPAGGRSTSYSLRLS